MVPMWALRPSGASSATDLCHLRMMGRFFATPTIRSGLTNETASGARSYQDVTATADGFASCGLPLHSLWFSHEARVGLNKQCHPTDSLGGVCVEGGASVVPKGSVD